MYVYVQSEKAGSAGEHRWDDLWTVGFYKPDGKWVAESDHATKDEAAQRVAWLNGHNPSLDQALNEGDGVYRP